MPAPTAFKPIVSDGYWWYSAGMPSNSASHAQYFWDRTIAKGWSDEQTRNQARRESGLIFRGSDLVFSDGSVLRYVMNPLGRTLVVTEERSERSRPATAFTTSA